MSTLFPIPFFLEFRYGIPYFRKTEFRNCALIGGYLEVWPDVYWSPVISFILLFVSKGQILVKNDSPADPSVLVAIFSGLPVLTCFVEDGAE